MKIISKIKTKSLFPPLQGFILRESKQYIISIAIIAMALVIKLMCYLFRTGNVLNNKPN